MRGKGFLNFMVAFLAANFSCLIAGIDFSSQDSTIKVFSGSSFYNNSSGLIIDGTFVQKTGGNLLGSSITFSDGIFNPDITSNRDVSFDGIGDIILNGYTSLSSSWVFSGTNTINGNGGILDLSSGGMLVLQPWSSLSLTDIFIRGLGDIGNGKIIFFDENGRVTLSNADIKLDSDVTYTLGSFYVNGPSTMFLADKNMTFNTNSTLTVDGISLWKDPLGVAIPGDIIFGSNFNLDLVSNGTIKTVVTSNGMSFSQLESLVIQNSSTIVSCCDNPLVGNLSDDVVLNKSHFINPDEQIVITDNVTIDGQGSIAYFAGKDKPIGSQFLVMPGKTVTLSNIKFLGLVSDTISLMDNSSKIIIGENVVWGLDEHITITQGNIQIAGQNIWDIQGIGGQKRLKFNPVDTTNIPLVDLGLGTLALQNIELSGLEFLNYQTSGNITGALGLVGNTAVNVVKDTDMTFYIESLDNTFRLLENNLTFNGFLNYAETGDNVLHFDFVLRSPVGTSDAKSQLDKGKVPTVNFATNFIYLTSAGGIARLIFDDAIVKVNNQSDAFIVIENSYLGANKLQVSGDPIWDASDDTAKNRFAVEATELEAVGFTSDIIPEFGIPIIVDSGHHRSIFDIRSIISEKDLLNFLNKEERPKPVIQLGVN